MKKTILSTKEMKNKGSAQQIGRAHEYLKAEETVKIPAGKVTLAVAGMTCASCAQTIEKALQKKKGVIKAAVNFTVEKAYIEYDPALTGINDLETAVRDSGYDIHSEKEKVTLMLDGMSCSSCAGTIEKALNRTGGVDKAVVNFAAETATVEFNPVITDLVKIRAAVEKTGYKVVKKETGAPDREDGDLKKVTEAKRRMWTAWGFTVPIIIWMALAGVTFISWLLL